MANNHAYVILECLDGLPGYPRFGFATTKHAEELESEVKWLERCDTLEMAAEGAGRLNLQDAPVTART